MSEDIMEIWDALSPDEQDELRKKTKARGPFISDGKIALTILFHGDNDDMWEQGEKLGFTGDALSNFSRIGYEVSLDIEVDEFGDAMLIGVGGSKLEQEIEI